MNLNLRENPPFDRIYSEHIMLHIMYKCDKKLYSGLPDAILFVQDIPTAACVSGNGVV